MRLALGKIQNRFFIAFAAAPPSVSQKLFNFPGVGLLNHAGIFQYRMSASHQVALQALHTYFTSSCKPSADCQTA